MSFPSIPEISVRASANGDLTFSGVAYQDILYIEPIHEASGATQNHPCA